jgi:outer membrane protein TolC
MIKILGSATLSALLIFGLNRQAEAQEKKIYTSLTEVWNDVRQYNLTFKSAQIQTELANLAYKTSVGNVINPRMPVTLNLIDNTRLQSNFIPAEIFGGPSGSFREVTFGQQYNALFSVQPQFDLLNMSSLAQIKSAKINKELTASQNLLNELQIYENLNVTYHNILSLKGQKDILTKNIAIAEQIKNIVTNRHQEGIARKQDVNEAEVNLINLLDKMEQLEYNIRIQEKMLALFFENKISPEINENLDVYALENISSVNAGNAKSRNVALQSQMLRQDIKTLQYQYYPILSLNSSFNWQNLSNEFFFAANSSGINYNFIGIKLGWDFPTVTRLSNIKNKQYQLQTLALNESHVEKETATKTEQLVIEYQKAQSQYKNFKTILDLKSDTYQKTLNQYQENILGLDRLLISQNDMLSSQINVVLALSNIAFAKAKVVIHNLY